MIQKLGETLQLAVECFAALSPRRAVAHGWAVAPAGAETRLSVAAGPDGDCLIEHCSFHPRPDLPALDAGIAGRNGFTLVFETPPEAAALRLTLAADELQLGAELRDPAVEGDLARATAARPWPVVFALLREAATDPALRELLGWGGRPFGAFATWMGKLPLVRGRAEAVGGLAEAEAVATPAGEVLAMLRAPGAMPPEARMEAALLGWLRGEAGELPAPVLLPLADWHAARLPAALAGYARLDPAVLPRLAALEMVVHAVPRPGDDILLRCQPAEGLVTDLLDAACRTLAGSVALPVEAAATAGHDLLRQVIARREAAFLPLLSALAAPAAPIATGGDLPRLALILGADDPFAARLLHVTAAEVERRCDTLLVMGRAADEVAQLFLARGRVAVLAGVEAAAALRAAAGRSGILALDVLALAEAVIAGRPEDAFRHALRAAEVTRLLALHAMAGCGASLGDSLGRLLRLREGQGFAPVARVWSSRHAAAPATAHLRRLWGAEAPAREAARDG